MLVAVTKTFPPEMIIAAWEAGQRHFGENRPEEGAEKIPQVMRDIAARHITLLALTDADRTEQDAEAEATTPEPDSDIPIWHMIGHIQSRKTEMVVTYFDIVHSVDRYKIAHRLSVQGTAADREIPVLLECNVSGEESKYGYAASGWEHDPAVRTALLDEAKRVVALPGLRVAGLMTVGPFVDDPEEIRPVFASLRALRDFLQEHIAEVDWHHLSMGMTSDYEVAVAEGATLVRIGRAIFGARH
ncbi:MAG: YggS family pyridoxal phosphate-dependent enzyme [Anaerolineae bacterium]|nr:YggS family pyridoxal phosphate-dependent enzyme [Anaerolineae bacterium]